VSEQIGAGSPLTNAVEQIKKAGDRASALTRQLLAFSRQQVLETKVLNLSTIVADMVKMLPPLLGEDIELQTSLAPRSDRDCRSGTDRTSHHESGGKRQGRDARRREVDHRNQEFTSR